MNAAAHFTPTSSCPDCYTFGALDPQTGCQLRLATAEEVAAYWNANRPAPFDRNARIGAVTITRNGTCPAHYQPQPWMD